MALAAVLSGRCRSRSGTLLSSADTDAPCCCDPSDVQASARVTRSEGGSLENIRLASEGGSRVVNSEHGAKTHDVA